MAYIKAEIADYGTEDTLLHKIKDLFINNKVATFTLISENFTERPYWFTVGYNNLRIEIRSNAVASTTLQNLLTCSICITTNGESVQKVAGNIVYGGNANISNPLTRTLRFLIAKNGSDVVINIASYNLALGKGEILITDIITSDGDEIIGYNVNANSTISTTYLSSNNQTSYTARPYHNVKKSDVALWLDPELPFYNSSTSEYYSASTGITGLGGATRLTTYATSKGDKYYCCDTNIAIKLGEEIIAKNNTEIGNL